MDIAATSKEDKGEERITPLKRKLKELKEVIHNNVYNLPREAGEPG
jgi:hypothetical protein